jgi:hypothetical protein
MSLHQLCIDFKNKTYYFTCLLVQWDATVASFMSRVPFLLQLLHLPKTLASCMGLCLNSVNQLPAHR